MTCELSFPEPRTITPILQRGCSEKVTDQPQNPVLLYVNYKSREVTKKYCEKIATPSSFRYINFAIDCLQIDFGVVEDNM
jgi:hypothetical protein